jgi:hypothetical protein
VSTLGVVEDGEAWRYCFNCGHRLARFRGKTLEGLTCDVCPLCLYILSPNQDQAIPLNPIAGQGEPCEDGPGTFVPGNEFETEGYLRFGLNVRCPGCGRQFKRLVARKDGMIWVPQHKLEDAMV